MSDREQETESAEPRPEREEPREGDLLRDQEHKGYGEDEGEREESLPE